MSTTPALTVTEQRPTLAADIVLPLRIEAVSKYFRQGATTVRALDEVNFAVERGEFVAVMGPSGSGKSTLLHVSAGLTTPTDGRVVLDGCDLSALSDRTLTRFRGQRVGLIFQAFNLIPTLTAEDNIALPALAGGVTASIAERLEYLLRWMELAPRRSHRPDALSGGEQQRVAIARALVADPALVLADEPTGSLDFESGENVCRLLSDLCREEKRSVVMVTHEPAVAAWADRIVVMRDGRILTEFRAPPQRDSLALAARYHEAMAAKR